LGNRQGARRGDGSVRGGFGGGCLDARHSQRNSPRIAGHCERRRLVACLANARACAQVAQGSLDWGPVDGCKEPCACASLLACRFKQSCLDSSQGAFLRCRSARCGLGQLRLDCRKDEDACARIVRSRGKRVFLDTGQGSGLRVPFA
jgi:hypothetical protein